MKYTLEQQTEAFVKLSKIIAEANGDWKPTRDEYKYFPVFHYDSNGVFGFIGRVHRWYSYLDVPVPLLIKSEELAEKIAKENIELYEILNGLDDSE